MTGNRDTFDVLLIQPPIEDFYLTRKRTFPYGLACLAGVLRAEGFKVKLLDALATPKSRPLALPAAMTYLLPFYGRPDTSPFGLFHRFQHFGYSYPHIGQAAKATGASLVGISSLFTPYAEQALKTAQTVKQYHPQCKIVVGGHHATALPEAVMAHRAVDFVIRGEGEPVIAQLALALKNGTDFTKIPGLVFRTTDGQIHGALPVCCEHLDRLPLPAGELVQQRYYRRSRRATLTLTASRGCPMHCSYCSVGAGSYLRYRKRSVAHVLKEVDQALEREAVGFVDLEDENLSLDKAWFLELLQGLKDRFGKSDPELRAMNGLFPPSLDLETLQAMQAAGFKTLNLSLGATSEIQLQRFRRTDVRPAFDRVVNWAEDQKLAVVGYVIAGAPFQSARQSLADLIFLAQRRVLAGLSMYYPAPGSRDYDVCRELGILPAVHGATGASALPVSHTTSRTEAATLLRLARLLNFMKSLIDRHMDLPPPAGAERWIENPQDRLQTGLRLLSWFLKDGRLRGVTPAGEVYCHRVSQDLSGEFRQCLGQVELQGSGVSVH
jgi:anaerobic magnesium-protoporphyrin IX monomethyl ester cyclase